MEWEEFLADSVKDGVIEASKLSRIPVPKNCDWSRIEPIGYIVHTAGTVKYNGVLVHHDNKIYYVKRRLFDVVSEYIKVKKLPDIKVK